MIAICPAGPPKLMKPSLSQKRKRLGEADGGDGAGVGVPDRRAVAQRHAATPGAA